MSHKALHAIIGLAGVSPDETEQAQRIGRRFEVPMLLLAIWPLIQWYMEKRGLISTRLTDVSDLLIWLFFINVTTNLIAMIKYHQSHTPQAD